MNTPPITTLMYAHGLVHRDNKRHIKDAFYKLFLGHSQKGNQRVERCSFQSLIT